MASISLSNILFLGKLCYLLCCFTASGLIIACAFIGLLGLVCKFDSFLVEELLVNTLFIPTCLDLGLLNLSREVLLWFSLS
jgi:hypothetical protein